MPYRRRSRQMRSRRRSPGRHFTARSGFQEVPVSTHEQNNLAQIFFEEGVTAGQAVSNRYRHINVTSSPLVFHNLWLFPAVQRPQPAPSATEDTFKRVVPPYSVRSIVGDFMYQLEGVNKSVFPSIEVQGVCVPRGIEADQLNEVLSNPAVSGSAYGSKRKFRVMLQPHGSITASSTYYGMHRLHYTRPFICGPNEQFVISAKLHNFDNAGGTANLIPDLVGMVRKLVDRTL